MSFFQKTSPLKPLLPLPEEEGVTLLTQYPYYCAGCA